jgi:YVTN family beta-propeller protein
VIGTATNTVVATVPVGSFPYGVAVTPDGTHAYVANQGSNDVSVIDTASNTVVATIPVGNAPSGVAVTPDGLHAYVTNHPTGSGGSGIVTVIDTATNTVEAATIPVGTSLEGVAVAPDGKHVYVANQGSNDVSVIDTASNTVEPATTTVRNAPFDVGIEPPPSGVPFLVFSAPLLEIAFGTAPNTDAFVLGSGFTLSSTAPAINPVTQAVAVQIGTFADSGRLLHEEPPRQFHLRRSGQQRDPGGGDQALGHPALRVAGEGAGREFYRDPERGLCNPGHRRRQRRDFGDGPH